MSPRSRPIWYAIWASIAGWVLLFLIAGRARGVEFEFVYGDRPLARHGRIEGSTSLAGDPQGDFAVDTSNAPVRILPPVFTWTHTR